MSSFSVEATWQGYGAWSSCTVSCGEGGTRQRHRSFVPGRYGASAEPVDGQATQEEPCKNQPSCPKNARLGPWGDWSSCTQTCYPEGDPIPLIERTRSCTEAKKSSDEKLNSDILLCKDLGALDEQKSCNIQACPGDTP